MTAHRQALAVVLPYIKGKVVEVTHKIPWGFTEIDPETVHINEYKHLPTKSDTTILHNLVGEGCSIEDLRTAYQLALSYSSSKVLVLEHNKDSLDWQYHPKREQYLSINELVDLTKPDRVEIIPGIMDHKRNLLAVKEIKC